MQTLAASAGFANWKEAQQCIQEVVEAIDNFSTLATQQAVSKTTVLAIAEQPDNSGESGWLVERRFDENGNALATERLTF